MKNFNVFGHQIGDAYRGVVSMFSSVSKDSKFESTGTLTPEEFLAAGDQLVLKFPTWEWAAAATNSLEKPYFPKDKQYLVTKNVPCLSRVRDLDHALSAHSHMDNEEGGWFVAADVKSQINEHDKTNLDTARRVASPPPQLSEFADLDNLLLQETQSGDALDHVGHAGQNSSVRSYDLSITWDKYYQTPRLWLFGYNGNGQPLIDEEVYQDVLSDYVTKTVTVDAHPSTGVRTASIHPCQHAKMMLKVINEWKSNNHPVRPDLSIFVFLKFISGVVPTINYDFTMDIEM